MIPSRALFNEMVNLLAADEDTLGDATAMKVALVVSNFVPSLDLVLADLTLASFTGSAAKVAGTETQQVFRDPQSNQMQIQILEPSGGWSWICTATPESPVTVYGWVLTDNAGTALYGSGLLTNPVVISTSGDGVSISYLRFGFSSSSPS